jgi:hypothetical protein
MADGTVPWEAYAQAIEAEKAKRAAPFQAIGQAIKGLGEIGGNALQAHIAKLKQQKEQQQQQAAGTQLAGMVAPPQGPPTAQGAPPQATPPNPAAMMNLGMKAYGNQAGQVMPQIMKMMNPQAGKPPTEMIPFEQAQEIAKNSGDRFAADPFIDAAKKQGRTGLNKQELSDMFKTVTTSASKERGTFFKGNLAVNQGRLDLARNQAAFGGQYGKNQLSLNTALGHIDTAADAYEAISNTDERFLNTPINALKKQTNDPNVVKLDASLTALKGEMANVFKGSGATDQEINQWAQSLSDSLTPSQFRGLMPQLSKLLNSRMDALQYQQSKTTGGTVDTSRPLTSKAEGVVKKFSGSNPLPSPPLPSPQSGWNQDKEKRYQELLRKQNAAQ